MSPSALLKSVKQAFPELNDLPIPKLRLVERAIVYAAQIGPYEEALSPAEHDELMMRITPKAGLTLGFRLRAYRLREDLTQVELAKKTGVPQANISAMEKGTRSIGLVIAKRLAKVLHCDYRELV